MIPGAGNRICCKDRIEKGSDAGVRRNDVRLDTDQPCKLAIASLPVRWREGKLRRQGLYTTAYEHIHQLCPQARGFEWCVSRNYH